MVNRCGLKKGTSALAERIQGWSTPFDLTYIELRGIGLTDEQIARRLKISLDALNHSAWRAGLKTKRERQTP